MKRLFVKSRAFNAILVLFAFCLITGCQDVTGYKDSPVDGYVSPKNFSVTGCKAIVSGTRNPSTDESIMYESIRENYVRITHNNARFNCEPGRIYAELIEKGQTFIIVEKEEKSSANCICPYDLGYDIGPLTEGHEYTVSIRTGYTENSERAKFSFVFSQNIKEDLSIK